jgi:hypothetical protein
MRSVYSVQSQLLRHQGWIQQGVWERSKLVGRTSSSSRNFNCDRSSFEDSAEESCYCRHAAFVETKAEERASNEMELDVVLWQEMERDHRIREGYGEPALITVTTHRCGDAPN